LRAGTAGALLLRSVKLSHVCYWQPLLAAFARYDGMQGVDDVGSRFTADVVARRVDHTVNLQRRYDSDQDGEE
jgi:hypothetical protein